MAASGAWRRFKACNPAGHAYVRASGLLLLSIVPIGVVQIGLGFFGGKETFLLMAGLLLLFCFLLVRSVAAGRPFFSVLSDYLTFFPVDRVAGGERYAAIPWVGVVVGDPS